MDMNNPPPGIIRIDITATDLDNRKYRLSKMLTFAQAREEEYFKHFMLSLAKEWKADFHG